MNSELLLKYWIENNTFVTKYILIFYFPHLLYFLKFFISAIRWRNSIDFQCRMDERLRSKIVRQLAKLVATLPMEFYGRKKVLEPKRLKLRPLGENAGIVF